MLVISTICFLIVLSICHGKATFYPECFNDTISFATKVDKSPIVVYGKATGKILDETSDSIFHVVFQVDCIFKGPSIARHINITKAGRVEGKTYCQDFPVGRGYSIAFLEYNPSNESSIETFIPSDFVEMAYEGNSTDELLASTCNLQQLTPHNSPASDICPAVSTDSHCVNLTLIKTHLHPESTDVIPIVIAGGSVHGIDHIIRSKSGTIQVDADRNTGVVNPMKLSILLFLMVISFVQKMKY